MRTIYVTAILFIFLLTVVNAQNATRDDAVKTIQQAEMDMKEMIEAGFSISYINDTLISAKKALERADFAMLIRQNATGDLVEKAKKALEGLEYDRFTYDEVLKYTREISSRKQKSYELSDSIRALEIKIDGYKKQVVPLSPIGSVNRKIDTSESERILEEARIAFEKERYDETETLLAEANKNLETKKAELTIVNVITTSGKSFIEKNWRGILIFTAVTIISGLMVWRSYRIKIVRDKLKKLKIELGSLQKLMEKTQIERFKEGNISHSTYEIRMEKYNERLNEVKQTIPVLEAMLKGKKRIL